MDDAKDPSLDYGRRVILDPGYREKEAARLDEFTAALTRDDSWALDLQYGVSVIIPTFWGRDRILGTLDTLARQDLATWKYEIIVVANGPNDGTCDVVRAFAAEESLPIRVMSYDEPSAGGARNIGLSAARMRYVTFVDDDDRLESGYLSGMLARAAENRVVLAPIKDLHPSGALTEDSVLSVRIRELQSRAGATPIESLPWVLGLNACKLIPTRIARELRYDKDLRSGEDVVFMAGLLGRNLEVVTASDAGEQAYIRVLRAGSISRRELGFDFAVEERLAVIARLAAEIHGPAVAPAIQQLVRSQAGFIARYIADNPDESHRVTDAVAEAGVAMFPWDVLNKGAARDLAIAYCFPPYLDSSGVVAAKAIAERGRVVDVISADMNGVRHQDATVGVLAERWIDSQSMLDVKPSFGGWNEISDFARKAAAQGDTWHAVKGGYETLYSRALWVGSHAASALFKLNHWEVRWTAEFSDPLGRGVDGTRRPGVLMENDVTERLRRAITLAGVEIPDDVNLFEFVELATYVLADELIFTNANQRDYMLGLVPANVAETARKKSVVRPHPVPVREAYSALPGSYQVPQETVNVGYFGSFYGNRTLDEVLIGMANLPAEDRRLLRLHVFCNAPGDFAAQIAGLGLAASVYVNSYLSYMDFLSVSTDFDVLIVKDVDTAGLFDRNPFLPSKYSDYRGSGVPVWAIVEDESPLSRLESTYRSRVGDSVGARGVLHQIVSAATTPR